MRTLLGSALLLTAYAGFQFVELGSAPKRAAAEFAPESSGCTEAALLRSTGQILLTYCSPPRGDAITQTAELP